MDKNETRRRQILDLIASKCGGKRSEFAKMVGLSESYVARMLYPPEKEGRKGIGENMVDRIEAAFKLKHGWLDLRFEKDDSLDVIAEKVPGASHQGQAAFDENVSFVGQRRLRPIPVISSVQAGALRDMETPYPLGSGYAIEYTDDEKLSRWAFGLDIDGLSMMPMFQPGDRLIVDPDLSPNPGDFVIARNGSDQATFKKYRPRGIDARGEMIFELVPLNDDYPTLRSDTEHLVVIGVVTEVKKKLRRN